MLLDTVNIPSAEYNIGANETTVYIAKKSGNVTAVCFKFTAPDGYSGAINMIMGIDRDGNILGVRVLSHKETPGLGDKIEVAKSDWILNFTGRSLDNLAPAKWAVKKDAVSSTSLPVRPSHRASRCRPFIAACSYSRRTRRN